MRAVLISAAMMLAGGAASAHAFDPEDQSFRWPAIQQGAIPDARLSYVVNDARNEAREAETRAMGAQRAASQARRRAALRNTFNRGAQPITIDSGTVMTAVPYDGERGPMLGEVVYPNGSTMTGVFGPDIGVMTASQESAVSEFRGWVQYASTSNPYPMVGVMEFKDGERFAGCLCAGNNARGIYYSADRQYEFIGTIDLNTHAGRPVAGIMQDRDGTLLAVVRRPD